MKRAAVACAFLAVFLVSNLAFAHALGVSRGEYTAVATGIDAMWIFRGDELAAAVPTAGASREALAREIVAKTQLTSNGAACVGTFRTIGDDPPDGLRITAHFACPPSQKIALHAAFLSSFSSGHAHVVTFIDARGVRSPDRLLVLASPDAEVDLASPATPAGFFTFVREGIFHILTGGDHLLFLFGLVLFRRDRDISVRKRIRDLVFVLTAFTLGHSVSLAVATLGGIAPPSRIVEPLVALSVAWVGAENLLSKRDLRRRWLITFPFGLVHGFAFASGLLIIGLPRSALPRALVGFNLGVEAGQLAVMACVLPVLFLISRKHAYDLVRAVLSAGIVVCGVVWFVRRVFFP